MYEYGSRVGFWRLYDLFRARDVPLTIFAAALALERTPDIAKAIAATDWDICAHGYRWIEAYHLTPEVEAQHIAKAYDSLQKTLGRPPKGFYCRYSASTATRGLVAEHGGYDYDSDAYNDELPYWTEANGRPHLLSPTRWSRMMRNSVGGCVFGARFRRFSDRHFRRLVRRGAEQAPYDVGGPS